MLLPGVNTGNISIRVVAEVAGTLTPNTSLTVSLLPGQNAVYTFEGVAGQGYSFVMSAYTATPAGRWLIATVYNPDGTVLTYCNSYSADGGNCDFTTPASGTYRLRLDPDTTSAASFTMWLSTDLNGPIALNDPAVQFTSSIPGQNRRFTFNAAAGQGITFWYRNGVNAQGILYLLRPDGSVLANTNTFNGATTRYLDATIPTSGTYTAVVFIHGTATANMSVGLVADQTGVLPLNVPAPISLLHGQNATYTFDAGSNQGFSFVVTGFASTPSNDSMTMTVYHPDGSVLKYCNGYSASGGNCDFTTTTAGSYRLRFDPNLTTAVSFNAVLSEDLSGTLTFNAAPLPFISNVPGQNIRYTFEAAANQAITLLYQDGVNAQGVLYIAKPDGTQLATTNTFNGATSRYLDAVTQAAGTYTAIVFIHGAATANMKISLTLDAAGTIPVNTAFNASLLAGQNATYSFAAVGGQGFSLVMPSMTTTPANRWLTASVLNPNGSVLKNCNSYAPSGGNCDFVAPTSGTYQLRLDPDTNTAISATIWLSTDLAASITLNDPAVPFVSNIPGQNMRYTFEATAGQNIRFQYTNGVNAQGTLFIFRPDGTLLASTNTFNGATTRFLDATTATSGTYTAVVFIDGAATAQMNVALQTR